MATLIYTHASALQHETPPGHPERIDRMKAILQVLKSPYFKGVPILEAPRGREQDILRAHTSEHYQRIISIETENFEYLDNDTVMSPGTWVLQLRLSTLCSRAMPPTPSAPCARPAIMPNTTAPWAFASSTTPP
jgi:acetoin utilization deacetylase AcuC-like enzyme